jgi:hypothetical protein
LSRVGLWLLWRGLLLLTILQFCTQRFRARAVFLAFSD